MLVYSYNRYSTPSRREKERDRERERERDRES
jgi:hypothetical protein